MEHGIEACTWNGDMDTSCIIECQVKFCILSDHANLKFNLTDIHQSSSR